MLAGNRPNIEENLEDLTSVLVRFPANVLEISSVLHVTLLVFLRLWVILKPLSCQELHTKMRHISIISIWIISILTNILPGIFWHLKMGPEYQYIGLINTYCFGLIPVVSIVFMYALIYWTIKKKSRAAKDTLEGTENCPLDLDSMKMTLLVTRVLLVLLVCYTPYVIWKEYYYGIGIANPEDVTDTTVITNIIIKIPEIS